MHDRLVPAAVAALLIALALPATAQTAKPDAGKTATAASKPAAKPAAAKGKGKPLARSAQKAVEEVTPIDDDPSIQLSEEDLEVAKQVYVGEMPCELGATVRVRAARRAGLFVVSTKGHRFLMHPVQSRTGAIRLEDGKRGAMWLQLGNKSMLMSQKLGQRLADECQSPEQVTYAEELKRNPRPSILEPLPAGGGMHGHGGRHGAMPCCAPQPAASAPAPATAAAQPAPAASPAEAAASSPASGIASVPAAGAAAPAPSTNQ
ncbi:hypothetical protein [Ramlibacter sp.]|uniref:hypothetical protein n=1 Tax=Ramlibacter sp. TaxID=1917967 RepID=UPI002D618369|nr:hypothetical protein [Ramlibacter sp.]HYD74771.1 hypothetical protein [Ramlibacter sp.]